MNYESVDSSTLDAVAYDEASSTLGVRFKNGREYEYLGVPESIYRGFFTASSAGGYFDTNVKKARYRFRKVR
ncbi:MAG TPA: KTSC domain-containing protein [Tepidisphaeraceae bacterium]|nr:KTSC domain-containing protein [Tepidisphaeraceae bacterium]